MLEKFGQEYESYKQQVPVFSRTLPTGEKGYPETLQQLPNETDIPDHHQSIPTVNAKLDVVKMEDQNHGRASTNQES